MSLNQRVLVYKDDGAELTDVLRQCLLKSLSSLGKVNVSVDFVDSLALSSDSSWFRNTILLVFPGGRDLPYVEKLSGRGNHFIRNFVENGGRYLGICAGAYYGSSYCDFESGTCIEVCGARELALVPCVAKGAIYPGFKYGVTGRMVPLKLSDTLQKSQYLKGIDRMACYYNGGCTFLFEDSIRGQVEVLAHYEDFDEKLAIVSCSFGRGRVVLSGVHPEMDIEFIKQSEYSPCFLNSLREWSKHQEYLVNSLLDYILS